MNTKNRTLPFEIRDAIHKRVPFSERERQIIDHACVQRLRHIRQLGFVSLVYPSATHDRFSHSIGTMHVASLLATQLFFNESASILARILKESEKQFLLRMLRLAGLLHDLGHAPFSHSAETLMPRVSTLAIPRAWLKNEKENRRATHEDYTVLLIAGMAEEPSRVLNPEEAAIIASLVHHTKIRTPASWDRHFSRNIHASSLHAIARSLIASNFDADRMDYLLRDSHFAGVPYGQFDLDWLIANLGVIEENGEYMLTIPDGGIHALEQYLFARYHMYVQVYMHKTAKCFEHYFRQALKEKEIAYSIPSERAAYAELRDSTLLENLYHAARDAKLPWSARLIQRVPSKRIARFWNDEKTAKHVFQEIKRELEPRGIKPFLCISQKKFLDVPSPRERSVKGKQGLFLFGLAAVPMVVIRKHLGVTSAVSLADHSFILKEYRRDISIADLYILREEYETNQKTIQDCVEKHHVSLPGEILLKEDHT